uniref:Uncharacterized protein n=1 Tax=Arundo donax TaxID=35708 RepID=A0A0A8XPZ2_ARUDO
MDIILSAGIHYKKILEKNHSTSSNKLLE